jgi:hypothetical protein
MIEDGKTQPSPPMPEVATSEGRYAVLFSRGKNITW